MNALEINALTKTYASGEQALKGIDLTVADGDFFALLGPNGAGKSTTIGIITSLVVKTAGSIRVFGHDIDLELEAAKSCIGLVPQEINFSQFESVLTIVVNQAGYYGVERREALKRAERWLKHVNLWNRRHDQSRELSGGLKRRLMIARALLHEPRLLILDEPTAGVDIETRRSMWAMLEEINRNGTTIILTTHYLEEAERLCRNIAIIDHGFIIENTSMKMLLQKLNTETFVLDLKSPLGNGLSIDGYVSRVIDEHTLEVDVTKDETMNDLFERLGQQSIEVMSMRNKSNRLEELFIRLLNRSSTATLGRGTPPR
jgi:ABC-2 type transport system ATP-binding protein